MKVEENYDPGKYKELLEKKKQWQQQQQTAVGTLSYVCVYLFSFFFFLFFFFPFQFIITFRTRRKEKTRNESIISSFKWASLISNLYSERGNRILKTAWPRVYRQKIEQRNPRFSTGHTIPEMIKKPKKNSPKLSEVWFEIKRKSLNYKSKSKYYIKWPRN